jgi:ankyrin repeat protein
VKTLLEQGTDVNARNEDQWTPLLFTALGGRAEVVSLLLEKGADVNVRIEGGRTPLMYGPTPGSEEFLPRLSGPNVSQNDVGEGSGVPRF